MEALRHIVVGTDFSDCAERALDTAFSLAHLGPAQITLLHVCELSAELGLPEELATPAVDKDLIRICGDHLADAVARRKRCGFELASVLRSGKPWEKISNVAAEVGASLIVIGRTGAGRGPIAELGNVASLLLRTTSRPVLIVGDDRRAPLTRSVEVL
jgi:nucleotide-binding universal stress UspA family protein